MVQRKGFNLIYKCAQPRYTPVPNDLLNPHICRENMDYNVSLFGEGGLNWSVLLFVNKILSISLPPVTCTSDIYRNKEKWTGNWSFGRNPFYSSFDPSVEGGTVLAFTLSQITQAERWGERTEAKSLYPFWVSDKGQKAPLGKGCNAFHTAAAPLPRKRSPGATKENM